MSEEDRQRRFANITAAHGLVQAQLFWLVVAIAAGYADPPDDVRELRRLLSKDCQDVVDAAVQLKRVVMSGGDIEPAGPGKEAP